MSVGGPFHLNLSEYFAQSLQDPYLLDLLLLSLEFPYVRNYVQVCVVIENACTFYGMPNVALFDIIIFLSDLTSLLLYILGFVFNIWPFLFYMFRFYSILYYLYSIYPFIFIV